MKPMEIEKRSFEIIAEELAQRYPGQKADPEYDLLIRRVIHTTADFEYFKTLAFSAHAVEKMKAAIAKGCDIITDTTMALSGITTISSREKGRTEEAKERGVTRSLVSMEKASRMEKPLIFAVGNAPTALQSICSLYREGKLKPEMVVGVPVGFVNVVEAKEELMQTVPDYIVARGRKGGSNVAASIVNAVLYQLVTREGI